MDLKKELDEMRARYKQRTTHTIELPRPSWVDRSQELSKIYHDLPMLYSHGQVYYAHVIKSMKSLEAQKTRADLPVKVVYCSEPIGDTHPMMLKNVAEAIFRFRAGNFEDVPEEYKQAVLLASKDDLYENCTIEMLVRGEDWQRATIRMNTVLAFSSQLPAHRLRNSLIPIIAAPDHCESAIILPKRFWTKGIINA